MKKLLLVLATGLALAVATPAPAVAQHARDGWTFDGDDSYVNSTRFWVSFKWLYYPNQWR